jgi:hypothetical protein
MEVITGFVWSAMAGGAFYDGVKIILGSAFGKLKGLFEDKKEDEFRSHLETIFTINEEIKKQLEELRQNGEININSKNTIMQTGNNNSVNIG